MAQILYLTQRIPYPPDKGDKITTHHILRYLAARHEVHLGTFVDDPADFQYEGELRKLCASMLLRPLDPVRRRWKGGLESLVRGTPMTLPIYFDGALQQWVHATLRRTGLTRVLAYSSCMAQYVDGDGSFQGIRMAHFADLDSDKWKQYAASTSGWRAWVYAREATRLLAYERRIAGRFDLTTFVAEREAALFRSLAPESAQRVAILENGVDTDYFDPRVPFPSPYGPGDDILVFTGVMDYAPNVDAVVWFVNEILPAIRRARPSARLFIVGSNPVASVKRLGQFEGVVVTGRVPDVRPYLAHASVAVAPLRMARGVQNKALEALAMNVPLVCTRAVEGGLRPEVAVAATVADGSEDFAAACLRWLEGRQRPSTRDGVVACYGWQAKLARLDDYLALSGDSCTRLTA